VARREIVDAITDWRIMLPMLCLSPGFPFFTLISLRIGVDRLGLPTDVAMDTLQRLVPFGALMTGFFPTSFSLVIALESFVGEKERNTLEALLAMPLSDLELYLGKLLASVIPPVTLSVLAIGIFYLGIQLIIGYSMSAFTLFLVMALSALGALVMVSGAVVVSSHTSSIRGANLLASFIILPMTFIISAESWCILHGYIDILWMIMLAMLVVSIIFIRMGIRIFNREEILSREGEEINLPAIARALLRFAQRLPRQETALEKMTSPPLTLWRLYRHDIPQLLAINRIPILLVLLAIPAGTLLGYWFSYRYPFPLAAEVLGRSLGQWKTLNTIPAITIGWLLFHNLRASLLASALSAFSFGTAAILWIMLPTMVAGFLAGEAAQAGYNAWVFLATFVLPHGIFELAAAGLVAAFGLRLGMIIMAPPKGMSIAQSMAMAAVDLVKIMALAVPLFVLAAWVEISVTPQIAMLVYGGR